MTTHPKSIAARVIEMCGGVKNTAEIAGTTENWVYRWRLPRNQGGTGGTIPRPAQERILEAAAKGIVPVSPADFFDTAPAPDQEAAE